MVARDRRKSGGWGMGTGRIQRWRLRVRLMCRAPRRRVGRVSERGPRRERSFLERRAVVDEEKGSRECRWNTQKLEGSVNGKERNEDMRGG